MALAVPLSRFTSRVGGGSASYVVRAEDAKKAAVRVALTIVGKILGLLGAFTLVAAFGALASNDSASRRMLHLVWILIVGASLLAAGLWLMKKGKRQV